LLNFINSTTDLKKKTFLFTLILAATIYCNLQIITFKDIKPMKNNLAYKPSSQTLLPHCQWTKQHYLNNSSHYQIAPNLGTEPFDNLPTPIENALEIHKKSLQIEEFSSAHLLKRNLQEPFHHISSQLKKQNALAKITHVNTRLIKIHKSSKNWTKK
jgi:hypothetical protein